MFQSFVFYAGFLVSDNWKSVNSNIEYFHSLLFKKKNPKKRQILKVCEFWSISAEMYCILHKGPLWATIFKSADTVHLILLCFLGDAIRCAMSADLKMVARNRPLILQMFLTCWFTLYLFRLPLCCFFITKDFLWITCLSCSFKQKQQY